MPSLGESIAACFKGQLVSTPVAVSRKLCTFTGFKVHGVGTMTYTVMMHKVNGFVKHRNGNTKAFVCDLRTSNGLEHKSSAGTVLYAFHSGGYVAEAAGLSRDFPSLNEILEAVHGSFNSAEGIVNRVHTEQSVTGAVGETFAVGNLHTLNVIGRMVRLKTEGKSVRCAAGGNTGSVDRELSCPDHKVEGGHKLGNSSDTLGAETCSNSLNLIAGYMVVKDELTKLRKCPVLNLIVD